MSDNKRKSVIGNKRPKNRNLKPSDTVPLRRSANRRPTQQRTSSNQNTRVYSSSSAQATRPRKTVLKDQYSQIKGNQRQPVRQRPSTQNKNYNTEAAYRIRQQDFERRRRSASAKRLQSASSDRVRINPRPQAVPQKPEAVALKPKRKNPLLKILAILLVVMIGGISGVYAYAKLSNLNPDLSGNYNLYNISPNAAIVASEHRVANVAIFGVDGREDVEGDRSDAIMIGSADFEHNKLKVTSLMRDTYVAIADEDYFDKLNAAYSLGGPLEALKTINENFDTAITDYVVFDFTALVAMVNAVGGVTINVEDEEELYWINQYLMDVNDKVGTADPDVVGTGPQLLTGSQALAYARIRYVGNGDYDRTQRQRNILQQVVAQASAMGPLNQLQLIQEVLPYIETSLRTSELIKYALNFVLMPDRTIEQFRLPADGLLSDGYLDGISYIFPETLVDNIKAWYQFVYEIDYSPSLTAQEISEEIEDTWW